MELVLTQFIKHVTVAGERWDLLAWKYYGDPTLFAPIVQANIGYGRGSAEAVFEGGRTIMIPIIQPSNAIAADLPPWKRNV